MNVLTIARRELAAYFYSPIAYVVLALFLVLQGVVFVLFLNFLNQPMAPPGAVMQFFFGGTILYWVSVIFCGGDPAHAPACGGAQERHHRDAFDRARARA
jgi:ABC-type transport system involved in multi-copper enzyme maturation permease subunit